MREPLSKERVLRIALELADELGVEALSMRRLAASLGVEAMSLYNHVANKEQVLDGLVEQVVSEIHLPTDEAGWRPAMRERAHSARRVLLRHPWALALIESRKNVDSARLRACDAVLGILRGAGFPPQLAYRGFVALDSYIYGFALQEQSWPAETAAIPAEMDRYRPLIPEAQYPHIVEVMGFLAKHRDAKPTQGGRGLSGASGNPYDADFEFGLDLILDGLERALQQPSRARAPRR